MNLEIECKLHLEEPSAVANRLRELDAEDKGEVYEKNWVFDKDEELQGKRALLRLRIHNNEKGGLLTHKTPAETGKFKSKHETETKVENAANLRFILESLGYSVHWYYEKKRHTFLIDGMTVVLDKTPVLGTFIEIEGHSDAEIEELLQRLNLDITTNIMLSYPAIWDNYCQENNRVFCDWKF